MMVLHRSQSPYSNHRFDRFALRGVIRNITFVSHPRLKLEGGEPMQEFIQSAVSQLGLNEDQAKSATGGLLKLSKKSRLRERGADVDC